MARTFRRKDRMSALSQIDITPLIDLAFSMLIIFMISAPLLEQTIPLNLPAQRVTKQIEEKENRFQVISITAKGEYHFGLDKVTLAQLSVQLSALAKEMNPPTIRLRADAQLPYQSVIDVIDLLEKNKLEKLWLDTQVH